jgi:hypothetical protein
VRLSGRDPDTQPIETVGLRPGEKLHEELFYDAEQVEPTSSAKVLRAQTARPPVDIRDDARLMLAMASGADEPALRLALLDYARDVEAGALVARPVQTSWLVSAEGLRLDPVPVMTEAAAR